MKDWAKDNLVLLGSESFSHFVAYQKNRSLLDDPKVLRSALYDFIADFSNWDNSKNKEYLETCRALTKAAHEGSGGLPGTNPLIFDPFAGGGSIPLEAIRVGADTFASDLNPVPVLLNKFVLEYIPKYGPRLVDEIRQWGAWIKQSAEKELSAFYPQDPDSSITMAYLWARTVISEGPAKGRIPLQIPLLRTMWISKRKGFQRALRWVRDDQGEIQTSTIEVEFNNKRTQVCQPLLEIFTPESPSMVEDGTVKGGAATCPISGFTTSAIRVKEQLISQRGGARSSRLYALYVEGIHGREFRVAKESDVMAFEAACAAADEIVSLDPHAFPIEPINPVRPYKNTRGLSAVTRIGCTTFGDLYNPRQALSIFTFYKVLKQLSGQDLIPDPGLVKALQTALALAVNRNVSQNTSMSRWDASRLTIKGAFSKQALAVVWDFSEANPFSGGSADWDGALEWIVKFIEANAGLPTTGTAVQSSATDLPLPSDSAAALITDPPYFAAIPYGDLSDFFYVWLRRGLREVHGELFMTEMTDKTEELIVTNAQRGANDVLKDDQYFRRGMASALSSARRVIQTNGIGVVVYAEGTTAGWEAIVNAIIDSDWVVTSSWPIDTEMENRTQAQGSASLQSSIHIVCRPREHFQNPSQMDAVGDWREVLQLLPRRIHEWMPRLAEEGVVGADAIFACLGPALEIFSRYSRVEKASGEGVGLKEYLEHVWAAVAKEALSMVFQGANAEGFEPDSRLTAMWLWTLSSAHTEMDTVEHEENLEESDEQGDGKKKIKGGFTLEFDAARKIAQGLGARLEDLSSLVEISGETARLLPLPERAPFLFGKDSILPVVMRGKAKNKQQSLPGFEELVEENPGFGLASGSKAKVGQTQLDRIHQAMLLFGASRGEALKSFLVDEGVGKEERFWRLAQALSALYPKDTQEKRWVDGVLARKKGLGF
jgi:adenine-specific DNA methylase